MISSLRDDPASVGQRGRARNENPSGALLAPASSAGGAGREARILVDDADPSTGLPATPVVCPEMVTPDSTAEGKVTAVTTFVGSDDYPARNHCEYDTTEPYWCGWDELTH